MADDRRPGRDRGCCADVDDVGRAANERAEEAAPEWLTADQWRSLAFADDESDDDHSDRTGE
jgi:hypothetical protein